ncbi:Acylphosphatase-like domain [Babesia duncani]|uniref:Acylphosphatase-like domain n=1 Tax=Babesia duncani TaxID=323732 RepID=A0AAD9UN54_9APIC|nr:Acylphosphatase-like domain [Babesia duncani]
MSTYFPKSLKNKAKSTVLFSRPSFFKSNLRPQKWLYDNFNVSPTLKRGYPVFDVVFDTLNQKASGLRRYKAKVEQPPVKTDYDVTNCHEMNHRFRFKILGKFNESVFESELASHCNQLFLVGWIKCTRTFAIGHLQGNVIATSYMKRWMEICGTRNAKFSMVSFSDENYAIPKLDYNEITLVKDYRKPQKKAQHELARMAREF